MKFSEQWLREWVNPDIDTQELAHQITMAGLEVDDVEPVAGSFSGVIVGEITALAPHPDADKLRVCQVSDGTMTHQVVCGAPNVFEGMKAPFAVIGAILQGNFKIKKAKLRGVESQGMLCSESELGLSDNHEGLMVLPESAPTGTQLRDYLGLDDATIDVDLTPNRSDCLSIRGLAREVGVLNRLTVSEPVIEPVAPVHSDILDVRVRAWEACPRYLGRIIRNVDLSVESPVWMRERLRRSGIRSIDPAVDVTNYVMLELGQPMHAFDLAELDGGIVVRMAESGEKLRLLDGQEISMSEDTLVIADHSKAVAMAGVMGGEHSGVTEKTRDLFLEAAFFDAIAVAGKARSYGLHTESSHRFERGVDYRLQRLAMERATKLLLDIVGGEPGEIIEALSEEDLPEAAPIHLREARVAAILGLAINRTEIEEILTRLGLHIDKLKADGWLVAVPSFRPDISQEIDLIEEIGRIYGYNNLPVTEGVGRLSLRPHPEAKRPLARVRDHLVSLGYQEAITYSFVDPKAQQLLNPEQQGIMLANPISSDMSVMRTTLWTGLLKTLSYNQNRQQQRVRLFETGLRFVKEGEGIEQEPMLAGVVCGGRLPERWSNARGNVDFYDVKGDLESLSAVLGLRLEYRPGRHAALHPGQCAEIVHNNQVVGLIGAIHPAIQKSFDLDGAIFLFELFLNPVLTGYVPNFKEFSKFPEVRRDLAIIVSEGTSYAGVETAIRAQAGEYLTGLRVFDVYEGGNIGEGQKSLALSLFWQHPERTLNDEEVQDLFNRVVSHLGAELGATLRS
ncbi:phenylalanine--tRNA ligase subunit beta [Mangrovitalea sediminis]|uniref:phenylalanine--tRNA ligase subunit beta n=1 Tax=Mangrovitalea sediminis TaxID=1982043 RepID=UPI000BE51DFC|nr:phenylalanine--tRNA ligase subunit beta [Mangrovitalea sediminis]